MSEFSEDTCFVECSFVSPLIAYILMELGLRREDIVIEDWKEDQ